MNTKNLNKQIESSVRKINGTKAFLQASEQHFMQKLQSDPSPLYGMMFASLCLGYQMRNKISTLNALQLSAKALQV